MPGASGSQSRCVGACQTRPCRLGCGAAAGPRRAEVLAALSISIDLGLGLPMEHVLRSALLAAMLADQLDLDDEQRATVYYTNLVLWIGCHADSHEFSRWFGDDLAMRRDSYQLDWSGLPYLALPAASYRAPTGRCPSARGCCSPSCSRRAPGWRR